MSHGAGDIAARSYSHILGLIESLLNYSIHSSIESRLCGVCHDVLVIISIGTMATSMFVRHAQGVSVKPRVGAWNTTFAQRSLCQPTQDPAQRRSLYTPSGGTRPVGLIGGMSWQTTAVYYKEINQHVGASLGGVHSANLLIKSLDYAAVARAVSGGHSHELQSMVCDAGLNLKAAGAQALALCANVAHKTAAALEDATALPVLHIVDFTGRAVVARGLRRVGLLGTRAVMEEDFYKRRLERDFGLEVVVPDEAFRGDADRQIFREMSKEVVPQDVRSAWHSAYEELVSRHRVDCVVLACTELRLVFDGRMSVPTFETTTLHAAGIAAWALSRADEGAVDAKITR